MSNKTKHRQVKHVEHVLPTQDRRQERKVQQKLRSATLEDDWDDEIIIYKAHTFKRRQDID